MPTKTDTCTQLQRPTSGWVHSSQPHGVAAPRHSATLNTRQASSTHCPSVKNTENTKDNCGNPSITKAELSRPLALTKAQNTQQNPFFWVLWQERKRNEVLLSSTAGYCSTSLFTSQSQTSTALSSNCTTQELFPRHKTPLSTFYIRRTLCWKLK